MKQNNRSHNGNGRSTGKRSSFEEIIGSPIFSLIGERAEAYINEPGLAFRVLKESFGKIFDFSDEGASEQFKENLGIVLRMLNAYRKGEYTSLPTASLLRSVIAVVYFLFLNGVIDEVPVLKALDEAAVVAWVIDGVRKDLDNFLEWEAEMEAAAVTASAN